MLIDCICEALAMEFYPKYWLDVEMVKRLLGRLGRFISPKEPSLENIIKKGHGWELD